MSSRDWVPLLTSFSMDSCLSSLVSLSTAAVVETMAAFRAGLTAADWAWPDGRKLPATRQNRLNRARAALIFFDIIGFHSYSPLNVYSLTRIGVYPSRYEFGRLSSDDKPGP